MTDSFKSPRQADVLFVSHHDTLHVNSNSNLDFSPDEHFRLDLWMQCEPQCITCRDDAFGTVLSIQAASIWSMCIIASSPTDMREWFEGKLISLRLASLQLHVNFHLGLVSAFGDY